MSLAIVLDSDTAAGSLWDFLRDNWKRCAREGKPLLVMVEESTAPQTNRQRRRYHALLRTIAASAWVEGEQHDHDWWHEFFAREFIGLDREHKPLSTNDLDILAMNTYMQEIEHYAVDTLHLELNVP